MAENAPQKIDGGQKWEDKGGYKIRWIIKEDAELGIKMLEVYVKPHGEHPEKTVSDAQRIYHITNGRVDFTIQGEHCTAVQGDTIVLRKGDVYSYKALELAASMQEVCKI